MWLFPGDTIRLVPKTAINPTGSLDFRVDEEGDVHLILGMKVHVAGLTPAQATIAVRDTYQPKYYINWEFEVILVTTRVER